MKTNDFLDQLDHARITAAIADAEKTTSGEIRVFVSHKPVTEPVAAAQQQYQKLGMHRTEARNGVLIYVAPRSQQFAVIGDTGVHEKCGQAFWEALAADMSTHFKQGDFTGGLVQAIGTAGTLLAQHFPPSATNPNELPDDVMDDRDPTA